MRLSVLEKVAGLGTAGALLGGLGAAVSSGGDPVSTVGGVLGGAAVGKSALPMARGLARGVGAVMRPAANVATSAMVKRPLGTGAKLLAAGVTVPAMYAMTSPESYFRKLEQPTAFTPAPQFGEPLIQQHLYKSGEDGMSKPLTMRALAHEAGLEKTAFFGDLLNKAYKTVGGGGTFSPKIFAGALGAAGLAGAVAKPSVGTLGDKMQRKFFGTEDRLNFDDERATIRMKALADFDSKQAVRELERKLKEQSTLPAMEMVVDRLKRADPVLADAARNPKLRAVMDKTIQSVYSFAPDLAKDDRAMQSILTEAVTSPEGGLSFQTIRSLAETQKFLSQKG